MSKYAALLLVAGTVAVTAPAAAQSDEGWSLFRSENGHVRDGNEALRGGDAAGALEDYDAAALELPSEAGVHLDRGLALLAQGNHGLAREAFQHATDPPARREIRAAAHYDIGLSFYREADAAATADDHEAAQRGFREAADAFRASLRQQPGNRDAAWNLELALRRISEEQEQQDQQQQDQQQQDQQQQDQQQQDQQDQQQDQQDQQQDQQDQQDQQQGDQQQDQQQGDQQQDQQDGEPSDAEQDQQEQDQQDQQQGDQQQQDQQQGSTGTGERDDAETEGTSERSMPQDQQRVLDALEDSEENFQGARARARGERERRRVTQDW